MCFLKNILGIANHISLLDHQPAMAAIHKNTNILQLLHFGNAGTVLKIG